MGELKQKLPSVEEDIKQAKRNEEGYQKELKRWEERLQKLSDQQDEGTMECSERIVYRIAGNVLTWWSSKKQQILQISSPLTQTTWLHKFTSTMYCTSISRRISVYSPENALYLSFRG